MPRSNREKRRLAEHGGDINKFFKKELVNVFEDVPDYTGSIWKEKRITIEVFCRDFLKEPLYPEQLKAANACFGTDPLIWNIDYYWFILFIGKGGGKDRTVAKLMTYCAYSLLCLKDHCAYFGQGRDQAFDLINVSVDARQAKTVFFKMLKSFIRNCINPKTGKNWFEERGADLREHEDIQTVEIQLPKNITCHSLNSDTYTGEGLCIFFGVVDEKGGMKPGRGVELSDNIQKTMDSRFKQGQAKLFDVSFKYHENDDMDITYKQAKGLAGVYRRRKTTWEWNPHKKKADFAKHYLKNSYKAKMTFECEGGMAGGNAIPNKEAVVECYNDNNYNRNPIKGNIFSTSNLFSLQFHDWFRDDGRIHTIGIDLAKGKESGCPAGLVMGRPEKMFSKFTRKDGDVLSDEDIKEMEKIEKTGVVMELALQINAPSGLEIRVSEIRKFIIDILIKRLGFRIGLITYDGYMSLESIQELIYAGVNAEKRTVESNEFQETVIDDFIGERILKMYRNDILDREMRNLIREEDGQINHPQLDYERSITENNEMGTDDVWKSLCQVVLNCVEKIRLTDGLGLG